MTLGLYLGCTIASYSQVDAPVIAREGWTSRTIMERQWSLSRNRYPRSNHFDYNYDRDDEEAG